MEHGLKWDQGDIYWGQDIDTRAVDDNRGHRQAKSVTNLAFIS